MRAEFWDLIGPALTLQISATDAVARIRVVTRALNVQGQGPILSRSHLVPIPRELAHSRDAIAFAHSRPLRRAIWDLPSSLTPLGPELRRARLIRLNFAMSGIAPSPASPRESQAIHYLRAGNSITRLGIRSLNDARRLFTYCNLARLHDFPCGSYAPLQ